MTLSLQHRWSCVEAVSWELNKCPSVMKASYTLVPSSLEQWSLIRPVILTRRLSSSSFLMGLSVWEYVPMARRGREATGLQFFYNPRGKAPFFSLESRNRCFLRSLTFLKSCVERGKKRQLKKKNRRLFSLKPNAYLKLQESSDYGR